MALQPRVNYPVEGAPLVEVGRAHSTRLCSPLGRFLSMDLRPVSISRSTTPKLNASPLAAPRAIFILVDHGSGRDPSVRKHGFLYIVPCNCFIETFQAIMRFSFQRQR
ncbi:unnamed protein product [Spirodela intermedia]|uniref:Uncharacterized protein n=1 Tax=Spirodela intermedia TaxID=51605 RepID=A0A7I8JPN1_SPIIN|nr:unnamed protein product [Spirodela intermedia]CAA6671711.1 unnamed protein product [Spirodela intermedia]